MHAMTAPPWSRTRRSYEPPPIVSADGHAFTSSFPQSLVTQLPCSTFVPKGRTLNGSVYPSTWLRLYQVESVAPLAANVTSSFESSGGSQPLAAHGLPP